MSRDGEDGFLSRWSRRKAEAQRADDKPAPESDAAIPATEPEVQEPFDVSTLPSIDSLTADSDLAAFMQKGVPTALRDAAISRMWVSDPAIRDYIGPSEMSWDFNAAEAFPGYGALRPDTDVARMVADIFEGPKPAEASEAASPELASAESQGALEAEAETAEFDGPRDDDGDSAAEDGPQKPLAPARRRHGGATPV